MSAQCLIAHGHKIQRAVVGFQKLRRPLEMLDRLFVSSRHQARQAKMIAYVKRVRLQAQRCLMSSEGLVVTAKLRQNSSLGRIRLAQGRINRQSLFGGRQPRFFYLATSILDRLSKSDQSPGSGIV